MARLYIPAAALVLLLAGCSAGTGWADQEPGTGSDLPGTSAPASGVGTAVATRWPGSRYVCGSDGRCIFYVKYNGALGTANLLNTVGQDADGIAASLNSWAVSMGV